jgi:photosystem II stability/assembly factor-like uncharacterized protein
MHLKAFKLPELPSKDPFEDVPIEDDPNSKYQSFTHNPDKYWIIETRKDVIIKLTEYTGWYENIEPFYWSQSKSVVEPWASQT